MAPRDHYQVNEIFHTVQGEGVYAGTPATFIRLQGCLVGCEWCDTKYTWMKGGTRMTISDILDQLPETMPHVVITGGEPTLYDLDSLIENLKDHPSVPLIQLETSGQNELKGSLQPDIVTISPKHRLEYMVPDSLARIAFEFKFVVDEHLTEEIVDGFEREYRGTYIVLMPEGCPPAADSPYVRRTLEWLVKHPTWHYGDRLQYRLGVR